MPSNRQYPSDNIRQEATSMNVELVISHYQENLDFINDAVSSSGITVYTKSGDPAYGEPLPNVGKNLHTYLWHIVTNYNNLPDWTIFSQDDVTDHLAGIDFSEMLKPRDKMVCPWLCSDIDCNPDWTLKWENWLNPKLKSGSSYKEEAEKGNIVRSEYNLWQWGTIFAGLDPKAKDKWLGYHPGAIYGMPKPLILSKPKEFYERLLRQLQVGIDSDACHYLERLWPLIFDNKVVGLYNEKRKSPPATFRKVDHRTDGIIYACQPSYALSNSASKRQFWARGVMPESPYAKMVSQLDDFGCSLLADCFNHHWVTALNMQLQGHNITRFVMLHDDIVPENGWMGKLLEVLDATKADLVAALVPIKDARGLTSTALNDPDDPWDVWRRLSAKEIGSLPLTFSKEDTKSLGQYEDGSPRELLLNTGCWVCDFTKPWRFNVHFEIRNRISFILSKTFVDPDFPDNRYIDISAGSKIPNDQYRPGMEGSFKAEVAPEDWNFSRQLAKLGADVRATREIELKHIGEAPFSNQDFDWGVWDTDIGLQKKWKKGELSGADEKSKEVVIKP